MGVARVLTAIVTADVPVTLNVETVIATLAGISTVDASEQVTLDAIAQFTLGATATAVTPRIRRGTDTTGVLVGEGNPIQGAAGNTVAVGLLERDVPGPVAGASYVLTVQQTAATGNGTSVHSALSATIGG